MGLRVALTHEFSWPDVRRGGERYLHELAGALARRGHQVSVIAGASSFSVREEDGVCVVRITRRAGRVGRLPFLAAAGAILAGRRFDVVHSLGPADAGTSLRARRFHRSRRLLYTDLGNPIKAWWESTADRYTHRRVVESIDVYGCLSLHGQRCLQRDYGRRGALTPGGVRLDAFRPVAPRSPQPTILYSGALDVPRKGVATLLESVGLLAREEPDVRLWLSGSGDASQVMATAPRAAAERTEILPIGEPHLQSERYSAAWTTVLPSVDEAFGLSLVESLACGTPIVATDHGALPELMADDVGFLFPADNAPALADAIAATWGLSTQPQTQERCRETARRHDWDTAVAPAIEELYLSKARL